MIQHEEKVQAHQQMSEDYIIQSVTLRWGKIPVDLRFSYGDLSEFDFTYIYLKAGGFVGVGEAVVSPRDAFAEFASSLVGKDARRLDSLLPTQACDFYVRVLCEAFSMAVHDLVGKISGLPVHSLLGGKKRNKVPLMPCIFPENPDDAAARAKMFFDQGFNRYLKTKLMGQLEEDAERVSAIRSVAPEGLILQGDANKGYKTVDDAKKAVRILGDKGLDIIEDPLSGGIDDYRSLCNSCDGRAKIMVDELARETSSLIQVLRAGAAEVIGLHPDAPGSLTNALLNAKIAEAFGVPVVIGGTGYTGVGPAAYQHLTAVLASGPCGELGGFYDHGMPAKFIESSLPTEDGLVTIPDLPGLGVEVDNESLSRFEQGSKTWGN